MSNPRFEAFLAELYTDAEARQRFLSDPESAARLSGLDEHDVEAPWRVSTASASTWRLGASSASGPRGDHAGRAGSAGWPDATATELVWRR